MKNEKQSNEELLQMLANATETYYCCHSHNKAARNKAAMNEYIKKLKKRGVQIPSVNKRLKIGIFNGKGSN